MALVLTFLDVCWQKEIKTNKLCYYSHMNRHKKCAIWCPGDNVSTVAIMQLPGRGDLKCIQMLLHFSVASVVGWPWLDAGCPPKPLYHLPPQLKRGEKTEPKAHGSR